MVYIQIIVQYKVIPHSSEQYMIDLIFAKKWLSGLGII